MADLQQLRVQRQPFAVPRFLTCTEIRPRRFEGGHVVGVGDAGAGGFVSELGELGEFAAATFAHGIGQFAVVAGKEQERLARAPFLAHEQQRNHRREQQHRGRRAQGIGLGQAHQTFAERAVAGLVVVLQEQHERGRAEMRAGLAA